MIIPLGIRNNNPANLQPHGVEGKYPTLIDGICAFVKLCYRYQAEGANTPETFISKFSPPPNPTAQYISNVCSWTGLTPQTVIDFRSDANTIMWARAIFRQENGPIPTNAITDAQIYAGIALANGDE